MSQAPDTLIQGQIIARVKARAEEARHSPHSKEAMAKVRDAMNAYRKMHATRKLVDA
jgi:hypothetical protein